MLRRLASAIVIIGLVLAVGALAYGKWLTSQGWRFLFPAAHGEQIGTFEGVPAFGNDGGSIRGEYGLEYECVEFVNRFYVVVLGHPNMTKTGNADDYLWNPSNKGLVAFMNGGETKPTKYDLLVFDRGDNDGNVGHIALVTSVSDRYVTFVQQNAIAWKHGWFARDIWEDRLRLTEDSGHWTVAQGRNRLPVAGWSRRK